MNENQEPIYPIDEDAAKSLELANIKGIHKIYLIYDLSGKHDGYVGYAWSTLETRLKGHVQLAKRLKNNDKFYSKLDCSQSLRKLNFQVGIGLLEIVPEGQRWQDAEIKWIAFYKSIGWHLWNGTRGGDGTLGLKWRNESKLKLSVSKTGTTASNEAKANLKKDWHKKHPKWHWREESKQLASKNSPRYWLGTHKTKEEKIQKSVTRKAYLIAHPEALNNLKTLASGKGCRQKARAIKCLVHPSSISPQDLYTVVQIMHKEAVSF
jgi:hypothetical protein